MFGQLKEAGDGEAERLGVQVCNMIKIHMALEEELFDRALCGKPEAREGAPNRHPLTSRKDWRL